VTYIELSGVTHDGTSLIYVKILWHAVYVPKTLPMVDISAPVCCSPVAAGPLGDDAALEIALRLKALADPVRVKLVSLLFSSDAGEVCSSDLAAALALTESTVSHHLTQLRRAGLVESERRGMNVYHRPRRESLVALCTVLDPNCCR
jgi:ArsR family transcriptional regulator